MAIEIRELIIKATVANEQNDQNSRNTKKLAKLLKELNVTFEKNEIRIKKENALRQLKINELENKLKNQTEQLIKLVKEITNIKLER